MHLKSLTNKDLIDNSCYLATNMASSLLNDEEDNATRNTQQQQQQNNNNNNIQSSNSQNNNLNTNSTSTPSLSSGSTNKMQENEAKLKKQNLEQRKLELEKLLNEKSWLLQQLQKQETQILQGNFEYLNFNDFIQTLAVQYKQEQPADINSPSTTGTPSIGTAGTGSVGGNSSAQQLTANEEAILRRKPLTAKENHQNNLLHRRQSEISNRSSEYDNYPQHDSHSTHSEGGGGRASVMQGAAQATQQYAAKAALKKRSATVAGTTAQSSTNLQLIRQQHLEQQQHQQQQQLLYKQQQQQIQLQQQQQHHLYHHSQHPQQHLFKQNFEHHQVLMPHLQYATQKFYYTTLQPQPQQQQQTQTTQQQQQQQQYGRYIQNKQIAQQQTQSPSQQQQQQQQHYLQTPPQQHQQQPTSQTQQLLLTPTSSHSTLSAVAGGQLITMDNISLYSLNSNNVATLHRPAQQQQPIIVQCDKYYLSPTTHHISHNDGGGFIKSSQNIKEYVSPLNSPQHLALRDKSRAQTSQTNLAQQRGVTPSIDSISLAPSYMSMETIEYATSPLSSQQQQQQATNMRWRSQTNLPPLQTITSSGQETKKSQSQDMLNNNQYYNTSLNPPPPPTQSLQPSSNNNNNPALPPQVTQVKPFKPLDDISIQSFSSESQKKLKPKQWLESSLDGPVIRQTPLLNNEELITSPSSSTFQRTKLSSQSLNTARHYSMSAAQSKAAMHNQNPSNVAANTKLSQSTSYLNQMEQQIQQPSAIPSISQAYNLELSPQTPTAYKYLTSNSQQQQQQKPPARPPPSALYVNTNNSSNCLSSTPTPPSAAAVAALSPDIRIESPVNMTIVQPATFQPYKEVTKPFEMSDFYKYSTKFRQKENNSNNNNNNNNPEN